MTLNKGVVNKMSKLNKVTDREFITGELETNSKGNVIWNKSIGKKFSIKYNGEIYDFIITKYDKDKRLVYFLYNNEEYHMYTSGVIKCNIGFIIGHLTNEFKYDIGSIINGYTVLEQIRLKKNDGKFYRAYIVKCIKDGYTHSVAETSLDAGNSCPVCCNKIIIKGINDMWTTNPELAKLLADPLDG